MKNVSILDFYYLIKTKLNRFDLQKLKFNSKLQTHHISEKK